MRIEQLLEKDRNREEYREVFIELGYDWRNAAQYQLYSFDNDLSRNYFHIGRLHWYIIFSYEYWHKNGGLMYYVNRD